MSRILVLLFSFAVVGCEPPSEPIPYKSIADTKQMMDWILDPHADVIWASAGSVVTAEGTQDLAPTTEEGWVTVRNAAATIAEFSNLLMMPEHARERAGWVEIAQGLQATAVQLINAADHHDADAVFNYGGQLYDVCVSCHQIYLETDS
ncbi:MAG TPA: hypothetical protein QF499_13200 [Gammaproteobacteria bacterium]|jgi:hypothetical protein|nr:cytochrome c [Gammaproteobacteria bacterium]HJP40064.1 hypothetical protein [Gammaproteobacteria bacterium]